MGSDQEEDALAVAPTCRNQTLLRGLLAPGFIACDPGGSRGADHHPGHHGFAGAEGWAERFDGPERDRWQKPEEVHSALELAPGMRIADIGAATGYFPVRIARAQPEVKVYGVDLEPDMVRYLEARAAGESLANLVAVQGEPADPGLPERVHLALLVNTFHHIDERPAYFRQLREKYLEPGGRVAIIEFHPGSPLGPPDGLKLPPERVLAELAEAGFSLQAEHTFLPHQCFLVLAGGA